MSSYHSQSGFGVPRLSSTADAHNTDKTSSGISANATNDDSSADDSQQRNGYAAPSGVTSSLVADGKLIDFDTAEVTALPDSLHPANGLRSSSLLSSASGTDPAATATSTAPTAASSSIISRPSSASSMRVKVDKPSSEALAGRSLYSHPPLDEDDLLTSQRIFAHRGGAPPYGNFNLYRRFRFAITQLIANTLSSTFLIFVVIWALSVRLLAQVPRLLAWSWSPAERKEWDEPEKWGSEQLVKDVRYYAENCGFQIHNETVETEDGYYLRMHRVVCPETERNRSGKGGYPVLIMHGLFQSSGSFVTSEERSLAFWLAKYGGYQVFLGNNRGVFDMGHKHFSRSDPRFWDYNIRELAVYDLPALVNHVCKETGYDKIAFIGHSQGNGTAFISLSKGMAPEMGERLSYFGALAPAVFAGPLTSCFPFTTLGTMSWKQWKRFFGVLDFIPLMKISYDYTPAYPYALLGYQMFAFLFAWTDANWLPRRKAKMFRFTPQPVSSTSIYWWAGKDGFASRGCILDPRAPKWWDHRFPPLSIYSGGMDFLVLTDPLIERLESVETDVRLLRWKRQEEAEHCDHFWAADAVEWCFHDILEDIETTRPPLVNEVKQGYKEIRTAPGSPYEARKEPLAEGEEARAQEQEESIRSGDDRTQDTLVDV